MPDYRTNVLPVPPAAALYENTGRVHYKSDCADFMLDSLRSLGAPAPSCSLGSKR